jgi:hypothetical protein
MSDKRVSEMSDDEMRALAGVRAVTMPHSCEVTVARLVDAEDRYRDRFSDDERAAIRTVYAALGRIAREDRQRMAGEEV